MSFVSYLLIFSLQAYAGALEVRDTSVTELTNNLLYGNHWPFYWLNAGKFYCFYSLCSVQASINNQFYGYVVLRSVGDDNTMSFYRKNLNSSFNINYINDKCTCVPW